MLLTNQKTINYENLYKIAGNHSYFFASAKVFIYLNNTQTNFNFNVFFTTIGLILIHKLLNSQ